MQRPCGRREHRTFKELKEASEAGAERADEGVGVRVLWGSWGTAVSGMVNGHLHWGMLRLEGCAHILLEKRGASVHRRKQQQQQVPKMTKGVLVFLFGRDSNFIAGKGRQSHCHIYSLFYQAEMVRVAQAGPMTPRGSQEALVTQPRPCLVLEGHVPSQTSSDKSRLGEGRKLEHLPSPKQGKGWKGIGFMLNPQKTLDPDAGKLKEKVRNTRSKQQVFFRT